MPSYDCKPTGGPVKPSEGNPSCRVEKHINFGGRLQGRFPHVDEANYGAGK